MTHRDNASKIDLEKTLSAQALTVTTNTASVDAEDALSITHKLQIGDSGDTLSGSVSWEVVLNESDDDSVFTAVAAEDVIVRQLNTEIDVNSVVIDAPAEDETSINFGYIGHKQYTRLEITAAGTHTNGTPMAASCEKEATFAPANN